MKRLFRAAAVAAATLIAFGCENHSLTDATLTPEYSVGAYGLHLSDTDANANVPNDTTVALNDTINMALVTGHGYGLQNNKNVVWTTSNPAVVGITPNNGSVRAVALTLGSATVTATIGSNAASVIIHVSAGPGDHYLVTVSNSTPTAGSTVTVTAQLMDVSNNPVAQAGRIVTWTSTNGGSFLPSSSLTNASGVATTSFITNTAANTTQVVTATDNFGKTGSSAPLTTQTGPAAAMVAFAGQGQSASAGNAVAVPPAVRVTDQFGNPVQSIPVSFAVTSGGGSITGPSANTDANGVAAVGSWTLGNTAGPNTLDATSPGLPTVTFTATATSGAATQLVMFTEPSASAQAGVAFAQQPAVQLKDGFNNDVAQSGVVVTAAIATGAGTLTGTLTASTDANGRATFTDLAIGGVTGTRTLSFSASGVSSATSSAINVTFGPAADILLTTPSNTVLVGSTITITGQVRDAYANPVQQSGISVGWSSTNGGSFATNPTSTNGSGVTTVAFTVSNTSGVSHVITATAGSASGTITVTTINQAPVAVDDHYDAIGNVTTVGAAPGVLSNDSDPDAQPISAVSGTFATANGGTFTLNTNGSFTYLNAAGFNGRDSVVYSITDGSLTSSAYAKFIVARRFWYVDNSAAAGDGRDASPFNTLAAAQSASVANDTILVKYGNGTSSGMDAGIVLKNGQGLIGQGIAASLTSTVNGNPVTLLASGSAPTITNAAAGATVQLASGNAVRGFIVQSTAGDAIAGAGFGTFGTSDISVAATGGAALDLSSGNAAATIASASASGGVYGVRLSGVTGNVAIAAGSISATSTAGVSVSTGSVTLTYGGSVSVGAGRPVEVLSVNGASLTFSGSISSTALGIIVSNSTSSSVSFTGTSALTTTSNNAVDLQSNTAVTTSFPNGGLVITTTTGSGFSASSGGTVTVGGSGNTVASAGAPAITLSNTTIGAAGLVFQSVSANGGANGVFLSNTGALGGLSVTGNSAGNCGGDANPNPSGGAPYGTSTPADAADCTGGTIQNMSGADGSTAGIGIYLNATRNVSLTRVRLTGSHQNYGIFGTSVTNVSLDNVLMDGTFGTNAALNEGDVLLQNASGSASISSSAFSGAAKSEFQVANTTNVTLNRITFDNVSFGIQTAAGATDNLSISNTGGGTLNSTIQNSRFSGARADLLRVAGNGNSQNDVVLSNNVFFNQHPSILGGAGGVALSTGGSATDASTFTYTISGNRFRGANGAALVVQNALGVATSTGSITNNIIGDQLVANSGSAVGNGLFVGHSQRGKSKVLVDNNQVYQYSGVSGIYFLAGGVAAAAATTNNGSLHATVRRNVISNPGTNNVGGIVDGLRFDAGTNSGDAYTTCLDVGQGSGNANNITNGGRPAEGGGPFTVIANTPGANPFFKFKGYPLQTNVGSSAEPFVDSTIGAANGGVTGYEELPSSTTTHSANNAVGSACDLF